MTATSAFIDSKKHLLILDALRGIAAIVVILWYDLPIRSCLAKRFIYAKVGDQKP